LVVEETVVKEALQVAYSSVQKDYEDLEGAAVAACQGLECEGGSSGSSLASRLRSLGDRVAKRLKGALRLGVQKALGVISTHYLVNFEQLAMGYIVPDGDDYQLAMGYIIPDGDDDANVDAMEQADAGADGVASALAELFDPPQHCG
jgi:hypothetical protein